MGLDMYLKKKIYVGESDVITLNHKSIRPKALEFDVLYWRKNYAIDNWFHEVLEIYEEDNCRDFYVDHHILEDLKNILIEIVDKKDIEFAIKKLSVDDEEEFKKYFEYYLDDFKDTIRKLDEAIKSPDFENAEFYYRIWY